MTGNPVLDVILVIVIVLLVVLVISLLRAGPGYEDKSGFHRGTPK